MWRVAALFFVFIAPVLAGVLVLAVLMCPAAQVEACKWIAAPVAWTIAKSFAGKTA